MDETNAITAVSDLNRRLKRITPAAGIALAAWYVLLALSHPLSHDEQMYVAAGALVRDQVLYKDFAYLQTPYLPYVYRAIFAALPAADWWLAGRLVSVAAGVVAGWCVWRIGRAASGSEAVALLSLVLFATHHLMIFVAPLARNHMPASACTLAAYACWIAGARARRAEWWNFGAGILGGCAIGLKLTAAAPAVALLGLSLWNAGEKTRRSVRVAFVPQLLGLTLALTPASLVLHGAGREAALFDNYGYHQVNAEWRAATARQDAPAIAHKPRTAARAMISGSGACLLLALVLGVAAARKSAALTSPRDPMRKTIVISATALSVVTLLAALVPTPLQRDYLAPAIPFLAILAATLIPRNRFEMSRAVRRGLIGFAAISVVTAGIASARYLRHLFDEKSATPLTARRAAREMAAAFAERGMTTARIATLAPILPLSAGLEIYPELATGPFLYRVGDGVDAALLSRCIGTSEARIGNLLDGAPPDGVLIGFEPELEEPLARFAEARGYETVARSSAWKELRVRDVRSR